MATLEEHLNTLSLKQIKNLVREHNLLSKIKLGQPKEVLIARLLEHFEELVDGDMISSIYKIKAPAETDIVPKKGRKRIALERPAIAQQQINPGEAVLRQMIQPKRKTGTLVSNNDKGLQEAVRIPEERVDEPEEGVEGAPPLEYMTDAEYDAEAKKLKEEISDLLDKSSLKDIMKVIDTYEYNAFTAKTKPAVIKFILYNFDGVEKAEKFIERFNKTLGITGKAEPEKAESDKDKTSMELTKLLMLTPMKDIIKVLVKLNFKGRLQSNKILAITQILQNFNTIQKMETLIKTLGMTGKGKLGRDGHGQLKILHGKEIHGEGEHWDRFKKIGIPILATAAAVGAAYAGHRAYQNNNRVVTYKGYNPDSNWTPGSYRELQAQSRPQVPQLSQATERIRRQLPIPPNAPPGSTSASVTRDWARGVRSYPPVAPPLPPTLGVIPYTRTTTRQPRIDLKAIIRANKTGDVSKLTKHQLERYNFINRPF